MEKEERESFSIYKFNFKGKLNIIKVILVITIPILLILLFLTVKNLIIISNTDKVIKQYENQIAVLKKAEEEEKIRIEQEKEKLKKARTPNLTDEGKKLMDEIYHSDKKRVFLTFDDGPSEVTPTILDTLNKENVKATFFVLGNNVNIYPELAKRIYDEGHFLGNHGTTHIYSSIYSSPEAVLDEYNRCNDSVKEAIGNPDYNSHLFRFPGGLHGGKYAEIKMQAKEILNQNNILNVDWNCLNGDAETNDLSAEFEMQRLMETSENKNSIVVLMHDSQLKKVTSETLPQIINYFKEQGYEFNTFYDIIK